MKGKKGKKIIIGGIVVVLVGVFSISAFTKPKAPDDIVGDKKNQIVEVEPAKIKNIQTKISATGVLEAADSEKIYSDISTKVIHVDKKVGDFVKKGDILISLDKETQDKLEKEMEKVELQIATAQLQLDQLMGQGSSQEILKAKSDVAELDKGTQDLKNSLRATKEALKTQETDLKDAQNKLEIEEQFLKEGISSQSEVDNKKKEVANLTSKITATKEQIGSIEKEIENTRLKKDLAENNLGVVLNTVKDKSKVQNIGMKQNELKSFALQKETLQEDLTKSKTVIKAPMDGVVSNVSVQDGSFIVPGTELMTIMDANKLIVKADVSPYYAAQLTKELPATIKYNGSQNVEAKGKIKNVSPTAITRVGAGKNDATSTVIPVEIELAQKQSGLKPGLVVDVRIITQDIKNAVTVPLLATMADKDKEDYVYVVKSDNTLEKRIIQQGAADSLAVQVKNMKEGELVVTNPTETLEDGKPVSYKKIADPTKDKVGDSK